jgi:uncharacterized membrane protein YkvA (DUF1232 family)
MANPKNVLVPPQGGVIKEFVAHLKLIARLMGDRRVSPWLKLIPVATLVYIVSPVDLIMGIPGLDMLDDAAVAWLGSYLFLEFCPPDVVSEHVNALSGNKTSTNNDDIIDAETTDINDK